MLPRMIDSFYWLGRYMERAENTARIVNVNYHASVYFDGTNDVQVNREGGPFSLTPWAPADPESMVEWLILDRENPSSVPSSLARSHMNAQTVRNRMDKETWECVNRAYLQYGSPDESIRTSERLNEYCSDVLRILHEFVGTLQSNMFRTEAWYYLCIGRYLERTDNCLRQLDVLLQESDHSTSGLKSKKRNRLFLEAVGATMLLQNRAAEMLDDPRDISSFLLESTTCPRSVRYSLDTLQELLSGVRTTYDEGRDMTFSKFHRLLEITGTEEEEFIKRGNFREWLRVIASVSDEFLEQFKQSASVNEPVVPEESVQREQSQ